MSKENENLIRDFIVYNVTHFGNYLESKDYKIDMDQEVHAYPKIMKCINEADPEFELIIFIERVDSNPELENIIKWLELAYDAIVVSMGDDVLRYILDVFIKKNDLELKDHLVIPNLLLINSVLGMEELNEIDKNKAIMITLFDMLNECGKIEVGEFPNLPEGDTDGK